MDFEDVVNIAEEPIPILVILGIDNCNCIREYASTCIKGCCCKEDAPIFGPQMSSIEAEEWFASCETCC